MREVDAAQSGGEVDVGWLAAARRSSRVRLSNAETEKKVREAEEWQLAQLLGQERRLLVRCVL